MSSLEAMPRSIVDVELLRTAPEPEPNAWLDPYSITEFFADHAFVRYLAEQREAIFAKNGRIKPPKLFAIRLGTGDSVTIGDSHFSDTFKVRLLQADDGGAILSILTDYSGEVLYHDPAFVKETTTATEPEKGSAA